MARKLCISFFVAFNLLSIALVNGQSRQVFSYYDENERLIKESFTLRSDNSKVLQGPYKAYYESGVLKIEGSYVNNIPHGDWKFYHESGRTRMKGRVINGDNAGTWEYFHEDGSLSMRGNLKGDQRIGRWKMYHPNGFIKTDGVYIEGEKEGSWKYYNEAGVKYAEGVYEQGEGIYKEFYPSGTVKMRGKVIDGVRVEEWKFYYEDGTVKSAGYFLDGKQHGTWRYYNQIGDLVSEGPYITGKMHGQWTEYHENGNIKAQGDILDNQKNGNWKMFFEDGTVRGEASFLLGTGDYIEYYKSGSVKVKGRVVSGNNHGKWEYFYENGKLEGDCIFNNGKGEYVGYYTTGDVKMRGTIDEDIKTGIWELYNQDGTIAGYYKPYYEDGNTTFWREKDPVVRRSTSPNKGRKAGSYRYKVSKIKYFKPKVNEFRAFIIGYNPIAPVLNSFPLGVEYYMQERLGYELLANFLRNPFFRDHSNLSSGELYNQGYSVALRQKFYSREKKLGVPYFGHEFRYTDLKHSTNVTDNQDPQNIFPVSQKENKYEYSLFVGNRYWKSSTEGGFTIDGYVGLGIGYRNRTPEYEPSAEYDQLFSDLPDSKVSYAIRFGVNLGIGIRSKRR